MLKGYLVLFLRSQSKRFSAVSPAPFSFSYFITLCERMNENRSSTNKSDIECWRRTTWVRCKTPHSASSSLPQCDLHYSVPIAFCLHYYSKLESKNGYQVRSVWAPLHWFERLATSRNAHERTLTRRFPPLHLHSWPGRLFEWLILRECHLGCVRRPYVEVCFGRRRESVSIIRYYY